MIDNEVRNNCFFCGSEKITSQSLNRVYCLSCKKRYSFNRALKIGKILECFALEVPALKASSFLRSNYRVIHRIYHEIRKRIEIHHKTHPFYTLFDDFFIKDDHSGKDTLLFVLENGLLFAKYFGKVVFDRNSLKRLTDQRESKIMILQAEQFGNFKDYKKEKEGKVPDFYYFIRRILRKYPGISKRNLHLYLQEAVFRYNYRKGNLREAVLKLWQKIPND